MGVFLVLDVNIDHMDKGFVSLMQTLSSTIIKTGSGQPNQKKLDQRSWYVIRLDLQLTWVKTC